MGYGKRALEELEHVKCDGCERRVPGWTNEIYKSWKRYVNGADRNYLVEGTSFSSYVSLKYHFRKHPCYKKVAKVRKRWFRPTKKYCDVIIRNFPWLLGLFYADGYIRNGSQIAFALSAHESAIADEVVRQLKEILGKQSHIVKSMVGNMYEVRFHSVEFCENFPDKRDKDSFLSIWKGFSVKEKMQFIGGFIDGDGGCSFEDGINSIQIYSKNQVFVLDSFFTFLKQHGYISLRRNKLYLSPSVGLILRPFTVKRKIKKHYTGKVDVVKALNHLKCGTSAYRISKIMGFNKKTVLLALKRSYGKHLIEELFAKNKEKKRNEEKCYD